MDYIEPLGGATDDPYINRNPGTGTPGSKVPAQVFNDIQAELLNLIEAAGLTPNEEDLTQLTQAVAALSGFSISELTEDVTPDVLADFLATYDDDAEENKKVALSTLLTRFMGGRMAIDAEADWNAVLTPGMYNTAGSTYTNAPLGAGAHTGCLWIIGRSQSADHITQVFFYSAATPAIWTRTTIDGGDNWSAWFELSKTGIQVARLSYTVAANTAGPTYASGAWRTGLLNTEDFDPDGIVSLSSNEFTLQPGTYKISGLISHGWLSTAVVRQRIYNVTDAAVAINGNNYAYSGSIQGSAALLDGFVTIATAKTFRMEIKTSATTAAFAALNDGAEVYTTLNIQKVA
jgi:hypothetical protein